MVMAAGRAPSIGSLLTQPQVPAPGVPADPRQVGLWGKFQQRLEQDPNLRMALLTTGLNMLQSPQPGQNGFDVFSNAALTGVGTLDQLRQRDAAAEAAARDEGRANRQLDIAEEGVDVRRETAERTSADRNRATTAQANQFAERMDHLNATLNENRRQFNERMKAGGFEGASGTTGTERILEGNTRALMAAFPDVYPDTPEGKAKARVRASGMDASGDPLRQASLGVQLYGDLTQANQLRDEPWTEDQIREQVMATIQHFAGDPTQQTGAPAAAAGEQPDPLDGTKLAHPDAGELTVVKVADGQYKLQNANGQLSTQTYTAEQLRSQ